MEFLRRFQETDHDRAQSLFSAYLDGRLTPQEMAWLEGHLRICGATCPQDLETLRRTVQLMRELPPVKPPRPFTLRPEMAAARQVPTRGWMQVYLPRATALAAMLLFLLVAGDLGLSFYYSAPAPLAAPAVAPEMETVPADRGFGGEVTPEPGATPTPEAEALTQEAPVEAAPPVHPFASIFRTLEAVTLGILLILGFLTVGLAWRNQRSP